ncbi:MAG: NAD(+) diphosphatase, partial [Solirubrobacteraceae bacterium]
PEARIVLAGSEGVLIGGDGRASAVVRAAAPVGLSSGAVLLGPDAVLLGLEGDAARFAVDLDGLDVDARAAMVDGGRVVSLRDAGALLSHAEGGLAAYAVALLNWHRRHRFCANCGAVTVIAEAGYLRHCPGCGANHFPRTDPVVIMTVVWRDRLLLGRRAGWPQGRMSVLAGFVSPGETVEEAVVREVEEESGIAVRDPVFVASQPWPFPASLMLGFHARSDGGEPRVGDGELEEVGWYSKGEVDAAARGAHPVLQLPPPVSVARFLIDRWLTATR